MRILSASAQVELVFQRSRFLGLLEPVDHPERARALLKEAKSQYFDASHVVHAFRTGPEGSETQGCSDDGEPPGTAGRPVLDVLRGGEGGGDTLLLVVRWFGGTKLGTGGLVKAYGDTAKAVLAQAVWEERRAWVTARITVDWAQHRLLRGSLVEAGGRIESETFTDGVTVEAKIPVEAFEGLQAFAVDLSRGRSRWILDPTPGS